MIAENISLTLERMHNACLRAGRKRDEITLVAVSKNCGADMVAEAFRAGLDNFGENKALELKEKFPAAPAGVTWHFIGHLQTNKIKYIVGPVSYIHSLDSLKLAEEIERTFSRAQKRVQALLEVKTSDEATKFGLTDEREILRIAEYCMNSSSIALTGLMTMAPFTRDERAIRKSFSDLRGLRDRLVGLGCPARHLSMGMTNDFEIAIEEGATMVRVGSAIFQS